jgi:hypothetical protein
VAESGLRAMEEWRENCLMTLKTLKECIKVKEVEAKLDGQQRWWMRITRNRIIAKYLLR